MYIVTKENEKEKLKLQTNKIIDEINSCSDVTRRKELLEKVSSSNDPVLIREALTKIILSDSDKEKLLNSLRSKSDSAYFTQQLLYLYFKDAESLISSFGSANNFYDYILSDKYLDKDNIPKEVLDSIDFSAKDESNNQMIVTRTMINQHILPHASDDKLPVVDVHYNSAKSYKRK